MTRNRGCLLGTWGPRGLLCVRDGRATARGAAGESRAGDLGKERREDPGRQSPGRPPAADSVGTAGPLAGITDVLYRLLDFCVIMIDKE